MCPALCTPTALRHGLGVLFNPRQVLELSLKLTTEQVIQQRGRSSSFITLSFVGMFTPGIYGAKQ
jgi:hypothetical protein